MRRVNSVRAFHGHRLVFDPSIRAAFCWRFKQMFVLEALALLPRLVGVGEINSLARRRMAGPPQFIEQTRAMNTQILNLELYRGGGVRVVVARDLQGEPVGFVLQVAGERQDERIEREVADGEKEQDERPGSDVGQAIETKPRLEPADKSSIHPIKNVEPKKGQSG